MKPVLSSAIVVAIAATVYASPPIQLHPKNPHYFLFRGEGVALIGSGEHYGAVINASFDFHRYLATLESDGLNYTRLFGGAYVEVPAKSFGILRNDLAPAPDRYLAPWLRSAVSGYAGGGNKFDLNRWNPEYFRRLHEFLMEAAKRGVVVELTLFSSEYDEKQWNFSPFNRANNVNETSGIDWKKLHTLENGNILPYQERYVRKLVQEAGQFDNVIFEIQNEPWSDRPILASVVNPYLQGAAREQYPNSIEIADPLSLAWQARVAGWITAADAAPPNRHLIAQNYCNFKFSVRNLVSGASVVNFHYAYARAVALNYGLGKALSYDETGFLGRSDDVYRRQAWNFMLAGGSTFDNLDYSFSPGHEDGTDNEPNGPGGGSTTLRRQLRYLRDFLHEFDLTNLQRDTGTVRHAAGAAAHVLSSSGADYALYFDGGGSNEAILDLPSGRYSGVWLDPIEGKSKSFELVHRGGQKVLNTPPSKDGIALRLKRVAQ